VAFWAAKMVMEGTVSTIVVVAAVTGSYMAAVRAALIILKTNDRRLIWDVMEGEPLFATAAAVRPQIELTKAFQKLPTESKAVFIEKNTGLLSGDTLLAAAVAAEAARVAPANGNAAIHS
jgi:hypothetical protein